MAGLGDIVQKALYLGVGIASYAGEKASSKLGELRTQAQKLADELVERGEMTTDEARKFVEDMMKQAQQPVSPQKPTQSQSTTNEPRLIEIVSDDEQPSTQDKEAQDVEAMRRQVQALQEELQKLKRS